MGFDLARFARATMAPREAEVKIPEMKCWFPEGEEPVFKVRGLTGEEYYSVRAAVQKRTDIEAIAQKLFSGDGGAIAEAVREHYGAVPEEYARRVEVLKLGSVDPKFDHMQALKFFQNFPTPATMITTEILRATGEGSVVGESKGSGGTPASATTSI